jgi:hypothetical protein
MIFRPDAEFTTDIPDDFVDWVGADEDDIPPLSGRSVAEAISGILQPLGYSISPAELHDEHGWDFEVSGDKMTVYFQVTQIGSECILLSNQGILSFGPKPSYCDLMTRLDIGLKADARFGNIRWYRPAEHRHTDPGADCPVTYETKSVKKAGFFARLSARFK